MIIENIKQALATHKDKEDVFKIGYIKEYLQTIILQQIYEIQACKDLVFYGGTALRFLFGLNRLSEDLDFMGRGFDAFVCLGDSLQAFFKKNKLTVSYKIQKFRVTLNFKNLLSHFGITYGNSKDLYIKIEISDHPDFCKDFTTTLYPIFKYNHSLLIRSLDKPTLFSSKLNAVLYRNWEKLYGEHKVHVKGRDIYDLFWYLTSGWTPNIDCIIGIHSIGELKIKLAKIIEHVDFTEVVLDIANFVEDKQMVDFLKTNGKTYLLDTIKKL